MTNVLFSKKSSSELCPMQNNSVAVTYLWDFDDGTTSTQSNPIHIFPSRGNYQVSLKVTNDINGCTHEFINQVRVTIPEANFTYLVNNLEIPDIKLCMQQKTPDISIVCWGGTLSNIEILVEDLLENEEILCEVIVIQQLYPLNADAIVESVKKTKKIVIIDDSSGSNSLGTEIISQLSQKGLSFKSKIICSNEDIIPSSKLLEKKHYPDNKTMYNELKKFFLIP